MLLGLTNVTFPYIHRQILFLFLIIIIIIIVLDCFYNYIISTDSSLPLIVYLVFTNIYHKLCDYTKYRKVCDFNLNAYVHVTFIAFCNFYIL